MFLWASVEGFQPIYSSHRTVRLRVEPFLNNAFRQCSLVNFGINLRYIPIIMPIGMRERYPARSRISRKENLYDCAPQLDYDIFVNGTFEQQLTEYIRGIATCAPHLRKLGATPEQIEDFEHIMATAVQEIISQRS